MQSRLSPRQILLRGETKKLKPKKHSNRNAPYLHIHQASHSRETLAAYSARSHGKRFSSRNVGALITPRSRRTRWGEIFSEARIVDCIVVESDSERRKLAPTPTSRYIRNRFTFSEIIVLGVEARGCLNITGRNVVTILRVDFVTIPYARRIPRIEEQRILLSRSPCRTPSQRKANG